MSGVNWLPYWMIDNVDPHVNGRFLIYSQNRLVKALTRNFYREPEIIEAQKYQIQEVCRKLCGHEAILAYDLGNESSNCVIPDLRSQAVNWLTLMSNTIKQESSNTKVTLGMHAEDLEENRNLWPQDAAQACDFLCMHGYPFYLSWSTHPLDIHTVPFLSIITQWLGKLPVLLQEFGAPSKSDIPEVGCEYLNQLKLSLFTSEDVKTYYLQVLNYLQQVGVIGAMAWCYADYSPALWSKPPLDINLHERHFGLFNHNNSPKTSASIFKNQQFICNYNHDLDKKYPWLKSCNPHTFYENPQKNLQTLYQQYIKHISNS